MQPGTETKLKSGHYIGLKKKKTLKLEVNDEKDSWHRP
jgi:hypothetical protein